MDRLKQYFQSNALVAEEYQAYPLRFSNPVPPALKGTLFRNGNGRFVHQGVRYDHLFDGDGMITSFSFRDGVVHYSNRHVQTREFQEENRAGKMLYRSFGTNLPGGFMRNFMKVRFKNASNTSIAWHGGRLLSLWEGGLPHEIDPATLETRGRFDYQGQLLNSFSPLDKLIFPELAFSAHYKIHPDTGVLHNFGTVAGTKQRLVHYAVAPDGQQVDISVTDMPKVFFTHDFILTESGRKVFFFTPVKFGLWRMFTGVVPPIASMDVERQKPIEILLFDADNQIRQKFYTDFGFIFHYTNGYDLPDGRVVVDGYMMDDFPDAESNKRLFEGDDAAAPAGLLTRFVLDPRIGKLERQELTPNPGELPTIHPDLTGKPYRYVWSLSKPAGADYHLLDAIQKTDVDNGDYLIREYHPCLPGEPVFIPVPGATAEDEGWVIFLLFDPEVRETCLCINDGKTLEEITRARLPHNIPLGFHGKFVKQMFP